MTSEYLSKMPGISEKQAGNTGFFGRTGLNPGEG
jgi:hypothetical protein